VFDGYIRGAEVFVDTNDNLTLDANEAVSQLTIKATLPNCYTTMEP
jgi:hypothetical protein